MDWVASKALAKAQSNPSLARQTGGNFTDLYDFCRRVDTKRVNKRTLEALVRAGCFDDFAASLPWLASWHPLTFVAHWWPSYPRRYKRQEQERQNDNLGMIDMFAEIAEVTAAPPLPTTPIWSDAERLKGEKDTLGLFLTGHPIDTYRDELSIIPKPPSSNLSETKFRETTTFTGLIMDVANFGNRVVISLDDGTGRIEVSCYAERLPESKIS